MDLYVLSKCTVTNHKAASHKTSNKTLKEIIIRIVYIKVLHFSSNNGFIAHINFI